MATTGELRAIIEELELVDIGDAESYLGEEMLEGGLPVVQQAASSFVNAIEYAVLNDCVIYQG
jgi:hypothetical protein